MTRSPGWKAGNSPRQPSPPPTDSGGSRPPGNRWRTPTLEDWERAEAVLIGVHLFKSRSLSNLSPPGNDWTWCGINVPWVRAMTVTDMDKVECPYCLRVRLIERGHQDMRGLLKRRLKELGG